MSVHYAKNPGVPCSTSVEDNTLERSRRWGSSSGKRGRSRTTTRTETTTDWDTVDCKKCLSKKEGSS